MPHYFDSEAPKEITYVEFKADLLGHELTFKSESGIFSVEGIDKGTEVLINFCIIPEKAAVLDLGCGYGAIGVAVAKAHTDCLVECCDINMRAVVLCKKNIVLNDLQNIKAYRSDIFSKVRDRFDVILTNPPFSAGREVCYKFIEDSANFLKPGGSLQLVSLHQKGGRMLEKKMEEVFGNVEVLERKSGYRVYRSLKIE